MNMLIFLDVTFLIAVLCGAVVVALSLNTVYETPSVRIDMSWLYSV